MHTVNTLICIEEMGLLLNNGVIATCCHGGLTEILLSLHPEIPNHSVRLVGSDNRCSGRVEIYNNYRWGSVCDDRWGLTEAQVVCRQMGCGRALDAPQRAAYGHSAGPIWYDDLHCVGNESALSECRHGGVGNHNCAHTEDASVTCEGKCVHFTIELTLIHFYFEMF